MKSKMLSLALLVFLSACDDNHHSSSTSLKFNITDETKMSFSTEQPSIQSTDTVATADCFDQVCISDQVPVFNQTIPDIHHPIIDDSMWQATYHRFLSQRFHLVGGGYITKESQPENCISWEGKQLATPCDRPIAEIYLYDVEKQYNTRLMAVAGHGGSSIHDVVLRGIEDWQWLTPNSRFNHTEHVYLWGQFNARHEDNGFTHCGATRHLWKFDSDKSDFDIVHIQQCSRDDYTPPINIDWGHGPVSSIPSYNADGNWQYPIGVLADGSFTIPYTLINTDASEVRYYHFNSSQGVPEANSSIQAPSNFMTTLVSPSTRGGFNYMSQSATSETFIHVDERSHYLTEIDKTDINATHIVTPYVWMNDDKYIANAYIVEPETGSSYEACPTLTGATVHYASPYCNSIEYWSGEILVSTMNNNIILNETIDVLKETMNYQAKFYPLQNIAYINGHDKSDVPFSLEINLLSGEWRNLETPIQHLDIIDSY